MKKIVFIGNTETTDALNHIIKHREAGDEVYLAEPECGEQMVRRIIDADEVHLFHATAEDSFELGMVYFFGVHALHYKLHWTLKIFGGEAEGHLRMFNEIHARPEPVPKLMDVKFVPVPTLTRSNPVRVSELETVAVIEDGKFKLACDEAKGSCEDCAVEEECQLLKLRLEEAEEKNRD